MNLRNIKYAILRSSDGFVYVGRRIFREKLGKQNGGVYIVYFPNFYAFRYFLNSDIVEVVPENKSIEVIELFQKVRAMTEEQYVKIKDLLND